MLSPFLFRSRPLRPALATLAVPLALILGSGGLAGCAPVILGAAATTAVTASQERGLGGAITDTEIQVTINRLWFQHDLEMHSRLNMTVDHGRVLLTGHARTPEMRLDAVRLAWQARGVKEVINEIEVDDSKGIVDAARDSWITTQVRGRLMFDSRIIGINYSIDTVNGVVYLMGVARSSDELDRVTHHASSTPNVQRVVSYVRIL
mgnify:CR=1 FL=1